MVRQSSKKNKIFLCVTIISSLICFFLIVFIVYKYIKFENIDVLNIEVLVLLLVVFLYTLYFAVIKKNWLPDIILSKDKEKKFKAFVVKSFVFSNLFVLLDILARLFAKDYKSLFIFSGISEIFNILINLVIIFISSFVISFCLEFIFNLFENRKNVVESE